MKECLYTVSHSPPVNGNDIKRGIWVEKIGFQSCPKGACDHTNCPCTENGNAGNVHTLAYVAQGKGELTLFPHLHKKLNQGHAFVALPKQACNVQPVQHSGWDMYWVVFTGPSVESFMPPVNPSDPVFDVGVNERVVWLFTEMIACAREQKHGCQRILTGILLHILGLVYSIDKNDKPAQRYMECIQQACVLMRKNISTGIAPQEIAGTLNMSYSNFRQLFKKYMGMAPCQYMLQLKFDAAKEQLSGSSAPVNEIAFELGFMSAEYFSAFFKEKAGVSPVAYRKNCI